MLPSDYALLPLGIHESWKPQPAPENAAASLTEPRARSRIVDTHRVLGFNNKIGTCFQDLMLNAVQTELAAKGVMSPIPDDLAVQLYRAQTGYDPADPSTDQGTNPDAAFAWWLENAIMGYKLKAPPRLLNPQDQFAVHAGIARSKYIGLIVNLGLAQQNQIVWAGEGTPGGWGPHAVLADQNDGPTGSTSWGAEKWIANSFYARGFVLSAYEFKLVLA